MKTIFPVIFIMSVIATAGCPHNISDEECNSEAMKLLAEAEDLMTSVAQTRYLITNDPRYRKNKEELEKKLEAMQDQAARYLYDAYSLEPRWYKLPVAIARCENGRGNPETAVKFAEYAIDLKPDYHVVYETIGASYMMMGAQAHEQGDLSERNSCYRKSIAAYEKFIKMRKDDLRVGPLRLNIKLMKMAMGEK